MIKRIWHPWEKWECYPANFFGHLPQTIKKPDAEKKYGEFLADLDYFGRVLERVTTEWKNSCEHNLSNESLNRIAWLGQACLAYEFGIPSEMRAGFNLLTPDQQTAANALAEKYLNKWLDANKEILKDVGP